MEFEKEQFNFYGVAVGKKPGIYLSWGQTQKQVNKYPENVYKGFYALEDCVDFMSVHSGIAQGDMHVYDGRNKGVPLGDYSGEATSGSRRTDEADQPETESTRLVNNELLTYVFHYMMSYPLDSIKAVVLQFYCPEAISEAKVILWECYSSHLPQIEKRTVRGHKSIQEKEIDDILKHAKTLDNKLAHKTMPVLFVARNLSQLPDIKPGEIESLSLLERVNRLERQMSRICPPGAQTYSGVTTSPVSAVPVRREALVASKSVADTHLTPACQLTVAMPPLKGEQDAPRTSYSAVAEAAASDGDDFTLPVLRARMYRANMYRYTF